MDWRPYSYWPYSVNDSTGYALYNVDGLIVKLFTGYVDFRDVVSMVYIINCCSKTLLYVEWCYVDHCRSCLISTRIHVAACESDTYKSATGNHACEQCPHLTVTDSTASEGLDQCKCPDSITCSSGKAVLIEHLSLVWGFLQITGGRESATKVLNVSKTLVKWSENAFPMRLWH